jgi:hypothetical protein
MLGKQWISEEPSLAQTDFTGVGPGHDQSRKELIQMLLEYPERQAEVLHFWTTAFRTNKSLTKIIKDLQKSVTERKQDQS